VPGFDEIRDFDDVIDECMEWLGKKWTTAMIKMQLREAWPGIELRTIYAIIKRARKKICKLYNIDPNEYKGSQIAFYESVIRSKAKHRDKIRAAERLDALFGLEHLTAVDPADLATKIMQFRREMDNTIGRQGDGGSKDDGNSKDDKQCLSDSGTDECGTSDENRAEEHNTESTSSIVDTEKDEIIEELKQCEQIKKELENKNKKSTDNI